MMIFSLILAGCGTTAHENVVQDYTLKPGQGLLLASLDCGEGPRMGLKINRGGNPIGFETSGGSGLFAVGNFENVSTITCSDSGLALVPLQEGQYYFGSMTEVKLIGASHNLGEKRGPKFNIRAGKTNYIGHLELRLHRPAPGAPLGNTFALRKSNNFDIDTALFRSKYPEIEKKYPTIVNLAR